MNEGTLAKPQQGVAKMQEVSGGTGQVGGSRGSLKGGVYRHAATGQEIIALDDPITGDAQARGYVRAGFEWVREVREDEVKSVGLAPSEDFARQPERKVEADSSELKGIQARLNALEAENARLREQKNSQTETELSLEKAKDAAQAKTEERGTDNSGDVAANGGVNAPVTPVSKEQTNKSEEAKLKAKASKEEGAK